jgi:hypothetical protein
MDRCGGCRWAFEISDDLRMQLSQENKEILNLLESHRYSLEEFCYCSKLGFIESVIMERICDDWEQASTDHN